MGLIPEETIQEVLAATDIVELVEGYFPLKRAGSNFRAICPFHSEKTPSFNINPTRQSYHCFGCGEGGNAIGFVMAYENLDFPSAVKRLAERGGIVVRTEDADPESRARSRLRASLLDIHKRATDWFCDYLLKNPAEDAARARDYLKQRGLSADVAKRWKIGFAPANGNVFSAWAREQGFKGRIMVESGLMSPRDEDHPSRGLYSRFRDRVMFPLNNDFGETVAFSGRILDPEAKTAKYVNSPETILFNKSKMFFGLDKSKRAIARSEAVIICEGQLDMIRCFESGIENAVAPLGTAFTEHHSRILRRFAGERGEALLCFDSDNAGFKAAARAYAELSSAGLFVRSVELPNGEDPDSLITSKGPEAFRELVAAARPFYHFQIDRLSGILDMNDPRDRVRFAGEVAPTLAVISDPIAREAMVNEVATRLGIAAEDFRKRVANAATEAERGLRRDKSRKPAPEKKSMRIEDADLRILLRLILTDHDTKRWMPSVDPEVLKTIPAIPGSRLLTEVWTQSPESVEPPEVNAFIAGLGPERQAVLTEILMSRSAPLTADDGQRALLRLRIRQLDQVRNETITQLRTPSLEKSQILDLTTKIETQRKETLELKSALKNIAPPRG